MKIIVLLFLTLGIYANTYPSFTKYELRNIENHSGNIARNRVLDYSQTIYRFKKLSKKKQLTHVNFYLNQLLPQVDKLNQERSDYWETPKEFLTIGYGDCEDYAIIKYYTLIKLGFDKNKLYMTTVHEKFTGSYHMVLSYFEKENEPPLILDNLSFRILDLKTRKDLKVDIFISPNGTYRLDRRNILRRVANTHPKFRELMQRINKES